MHKDPRLPFPYIIYYVKLNNVGAKGSLTKTDKTENTTATGKQGMNSMN
jgi:hypothetical protein